MTLRPGEVVLIRMEFHQGQGGKVRPAMVLLDTGDDDCVVAPITSRARDSRFDFAIQDWALAGLNVPSKVRVHKLIVVAKAGIAKRLGMLGEADRSTLVRLLAEAFRE